LKNIVCKLVISEIELGQVSRKVCKDFFGSLRIFVDKKYFLPHKAQKVVPQKKTKDFYYKKSNFVHLLKSPLMGLGASLLCLMW
jgi:hypothetical protein